MLSTNRSPERRGAIYRVGPLDDPSTSAAWPALTELGLAEGASLDNLSVAPTLAEACAGADFVQESAPEDLDLKRTLLADISAVTPEGVVISSSTSGYGMSEMQTQCATPARTVVGHPFNPPYLIPLVEVVGGTATSAEVVAWTSDFYRHVGNSVITMEREVPGFIANRLQEALWREALHMVAAGEATVEQIDLSITDGPGLRWPVQGPMLTFHLAGGQGREAALRGDGHELDPGGIAEDGDGDGAADLDVEALPAALAVRHAEAGVGRALDAAAQGVAAADAVEIAAGEGLADAEAQKGRSGGGKGGPLRHPHSFGSPA